MRIRKRAWIWPITASAHTTTKRRGNRSRAPYESKAPFFYAEHRTPCHEFGDWSEKRGFHSNPKSKNRLRDPSMGPDSEPNIGLPVTSSAIGSEKRGFHSNPKSINRLRDPSMGPDS